MKKYFITLLLVTFSVCLFAQKPYKYIIIPTWVPEIGKGLNPYGISSSIQKILNDKSITNEFQEEEIPDDYCETLTVALINESNLFKNKLRIELKDCNERVIWKGEGVGTSKEYKDGFAEAAADAFKDLTKMPTMASQTVASIPQTTAIPTQSQQQSKIYRPSNLYYNYTYFTDLIERNGKIELLLINAKILGYNSNIKSIATLTPSAEAGEYAISWEDADGKNSSGTASLSQKGIKINLSDGVKLKTIILQKY